jgi:hypothetical protein
LGKFICTVVDQNQNRASITLLETGGRFPREDCRLRQRENLSSRGPASVVPAAARVLQLAQQAAERFNLVLVGEFLPLGMFRQFQNILHLRQRLLQGFDDGHYFVDSLADGGTRWRNVNRRAGGGRCGGDSLAGGRLKRLAR